MNTIEADDQAALFRWSEFHVKQYPELALLNGSLNGVRLSIGNAVKAKKQGMKKGFPDIQLPVARGSYCGLFIELKIKPYRNHKNKMVYPKISKEQGLWLKSLQNYGYKAVICQGFEEAMNEILSYLNL